MITTSIRTVMLVIGALLVSSVASSQALIGSTGSAAGDGWQSSWLEVKPPVSLRKGETLKVRLEGVAENVLIRLLPAGSPPESSDGIEGNVRKVPASGVLEITLLRDHPNVRQISAHAGREAWGRPLGGNNGSARIVSVERGSR
jgi:hypothetical protein